MDCLYETFDFLSKEPILETVELLRRDSERAFDKYLRRIESNEDDDEKRKKDLQSAIKYATIMNLCHFFLKTKDSDYVSDMLTDLAELLAQEEQMVAKSEFEAAAKIRDQIIAIRRFLTNIQSPHGTETAKSSIVNLL